MFTGVCPSVATRHFSSVVLVWPKLYTRNLFSRG
jgi:hypothetical protein